jgi:anti-sigma factor RsiW
VATDDDLLAAYLDGVGELTPDERHRVEQRLADDPAMRAEADATRSLLERIRALPPSGDGSEPEWTVLERQIRLAVGPDVPVPWWRRLRWIAPVSAIATTAAIALLWLHHAPAEHAAIPDAATRLAIAPAPLPAPTPTAAPAAATTTLWIDGQVIDVGNVDPEALIDDGQSSDDAVTADQSDDGLLPVSDLGWVDALDDKSIERAERWLARKKG